MEGVEIIEIDHIHLLVSIPPKLSVRCKAAWSGLL